MLSTMLVATAIAQPAVREADQDAELARVGDRKITVRDFVERYESTPWLGRERRAMDERNRIEFLSSMIAEELLAIDAEQQGVDWRPAVRRTIEEIERLNVLDALYRQEVMEPVVVTDSTIDSALSELLAEVTFRFIVLDDADHAAQVFDAARHGVDFRVMAAAAGQEGQVETRRWGEFVRDIEDAIYDSLVIGRTVPPIEVDGAWYVMQIAAVNHSLPAGVNDLESAAEIVRRTLQWRAEQQHFENFLRHFSADKDVIVHGSVFQKVAEVFRAAVASRYDVMVRTGEEPYPLALGGDEFNMIRRDLDAQIDDVLVSAPEFHMTTDYVLDRIAFKGFSLESPRAGVATGLSHLVQTLIHEEFLMREGFDRKLDERSEVRREVDRWRRAHLAYTLMKEMSMSRPDEAEAHAWEVRIQQVISSDLATADSLLQQVLGGADLGDIARRYSIEHDAATSAGVTDYFRTDERADVGMAASIVDVGSLFGPIETADGAVFFRLLDRRIALGTGDQAIPTVSDRINRRVAHLAQNHHVDVDLDLLRAIPVTNINSMVIRHLGFGNRMPAVPSLYKMVDWLDMLETERHPFAL